MDNPLFRKPKQIVVDGASVNTAPASAFRGLGMVTGNSSSRLLADYKTQFPEVYQSILKLLFGVGGGAGLRHIKIEMGADINSSSGTEPCTMRSADEKADVTRGAGFMLAADAKRINPLLTVDLLRWGEPHWVTAAFADGQEAGFAARYKWYLETIKAAYETYGLTFDFISPDANETDRADVEWLIYFSEHLKNEPDAPYDFSAIKLVASDEVGTCSISAEMMCSERLREAVDVIGLHYTTKIDENTKFLHDTYHKEIWYSEGIAPCNIPSLSCRADGCGLAGRNGAIDVANRIINSYANGRMVMYEFQPAVNAYYDGACYAPKQLITANSPWSGHYSVDVGFWIAAHFTRFAKPGWRYVDSACFGDGEEDHAIWNTTDNYMTLVSPDRQHLTMHLTNDSGVPRSYLVILRGLDHLRDTVSFVETSGSAEQDAIDENWFRVVQQTRLRSADGETAFTVVVKPYSVLTLTTMDVSEICGTEELPEDILERSRLPLPYADRFSQENLAERGGMPLYTTDQGGAFEVVQDGDEAYLEQKITKEILPTDWRFRGTPEPLTFVGDDLWSNYQAVTEAEFASESPDNYVGIGIRCNSAVTCPETSLCGFSLRLYASGKWELRYMEEILADGNVPEFCYDMRHKIGISAVGTLILCFADGHSLHEVKIDDRPMVRAGKMSLQSAYYRNRFYEISAQPLPEFFGQAQGCYRLDCMDESVQYSEEANGVWTLHGMAEYQFYNRTCAEGEPGSVMEIRFYGSGISLLGKVENAVVAFWIDGQLWSERYEIRDSNYREAFFTLSPLQEGWHTLRMQILGGTLKFDAFELPTNDPWAEYDTENFPEDTLETEPEKRSGFDLKKAALPLAGAAAAGVALAFAAGKLGKKLKKKK